MESTVSAITGPGKILSGGRSARKLYYSASKRRREVASIAMPGRESHNLPLQPTPLVGREQELATARAQLLSGEMRLLTLAGPGGVGKTRLALALAEALREAFPHGAWFVDLAPLRDATLVPSAIARTLGVHEAGSTPLSQLLVAHLRERRLLLVLDNFEHLRAAAPAVADLLAACPGLTVLVTSRERLRLRWERTLVVPPLALPDLGRPLELNVLAQVPSVALFVQRARAVASGFALTPENAAAVAALCARLDGLPLAIELAAVRANVLAPSEMLARMERRRPLLRQSAPDLPARHQTLQAAIGWSYDLLPPEEQAVFRRLGIFVGGWTLAAADVVVGAGELGKDALDSLSALAEKSLVQVAGHAEDGPRFGMLETVREYALEQLAVSGELEETRRRHAAYFLALAEQTEIELKGSRQQPWFDRLEREHDNLRTVVKWSSEGGESWLGLRMASALWFFWWLRGHVSEGRRWLETALAQNPGAPDDLRLPALEGLGTLTGWQGEYEQGAALIDEALRLTRALGDDRGTARALGRLGWIAWANGRLERALELAQALGAYRETADAWSLAYSYLSLGCLLYEAGQDDAAIAALEESLRFFPAVEERHGVAFARTKLALLMQGRGEPARARELAREGVEFARALQDAHVIAYGADDVAQLRGGQGPPEQLARLLSAADSLRQALSLPRTPRERAAHAALVAALRRRLGEEAFAAAWGAARELPPDQVAELALAALSTGPSRNGAPAQPAGRQTANPLSEREREVLRLVAAGLSNQEIADRLVITERTARFHLTSSFNKLGADNRAQAVALAAQRGLL